MQSVNDWKKKISLEYLKDGDMTIEQAKVAFLKYVYQWPTFGSAFFEVQVSEHLHVCAALSVCGCSLRLLSVST